MFDGEFTADMLSLTLLRGEGLDDIDESVRAEATAGTGPTIPVCTDLADERVERVDWIISSKSASSDIWFFNACMK